MMPAMPLTAARELLGALADGRRSGSPHGSHGSCQRVSASG